MLSLNGNFNSYGIANIGLLSFPFLKADFFPELDRNMFRVMIELPANSNVQKTEEEVLELRKSIAKSGIVESDFWFIGRRLPRVLYNVIGGDSGLGANNIAEGVYNFFLSRHSCRVTKSS